MFLVCMEAKMGSGTDHLAAVLPKEVSLRHFGRGFVRGLAWGTAVSTLALAYLVVF